MKGHIRQRGKTSWELKFDAGRDPATGERKIAYHSFRGTKREAQIKLAELIAAVDKGAYVEPSKITVAEYVRARVEQWAAAGDLTPASAQRYRQQVEWSIMPHIGAILLQKLTPFDLERWFTTLQASGRRDGTGGLTAGTIRQAKSILHKALREAERNGLVHRNVARLQPAPKNSAKESAVLKVDQVPIVIDRLRGRTLYPIVVTALFTGMRRGELLALTWGNVDLDAGTIRVVASLEQMQDGSINVKEPKTKAGRRLITLPKIVVAALREHRRQRLEQRLALGLGKLSDDDLAFPTIDGRMRSPRAVSKEWRRFADEAGVGVVTFHGLRHSHASMLIDLGVDVVTISKRLGHASPTITLQVYAHLFQNSDSKAAMAIDDALAPAAAG